MKKSVLLAIVVIIVVVIAAACAVILTSDDDDNDGPDYDDTKSVAAVKTLPTDYARLNVLGNADQDDDIDSDDLDFIKSVINGDKSPNFYCDVNQDGRIDSNDVELLESMMNHEAVTIHYIDANDTVQDAKLPINNLIVGFRRTTEMVAALGCVDQIVATTVGGLNQFGFIGFSDTAKKNIINAGQNNDSNPNSETLLSIYRDYRSSGITVLGDANGMPATMESVFEGLPVDVIRLPCTESTRIAEGMITMAYMLSFNSTYRSTVEDKIDAWVEWNDTADKTIADAVSKLTTKETGLVLLHNYGGSSASANTMNLRGEGLSECEISKQCGCDNLAYVIGTGAAAKYTSLDNETILELQASYGLKKIVMEAQTLYQKIMTRYAAATTDAEKTAALNYIESMVDAAKNHPVMAGYSGDFYFIGQEVCNGPEVVLYKMYVASIFCPSLSSVYTEDYLNAQFKEYMTALNPNTELINAKVFYTA